MTKILMIKTKKRGTPVSYSHLPIFPASFFSRLHKKNYSRHEKQLPNFPGSQLPSFNALFDKGIKNE
jgi:hypothetical protein